MAIEISKKQITGEDDFVYVVTTSTGNRSITLNTEEMVFIRNWVNDHIPMQPTKEVSPRDQHTGEEQW